MIVGRENLIKLFPDFKEDIQQNGIDLRVGKLYMIDEFETNIVGCVHGVKYLPKLNLIDDDEDFYILEPKKYYFVEVDREIHIPDGYTQLYAIRSTFARCGLSLISSVGDNSYFGTLMMGLYNTNSDLPVCVGKNERIIQAITFANDGTATQYDGVYQEDRIYKKER